ncbi:MAG TPA: preprotein translocase subunit SecY [Chthoniobacteraceae bacterium]|nr:preprotein translocase subunit SecY [Chthoniobacteraceae bacterium]
MISAFTNTFKIPELRNRVLFTLLLLVIVRLGAAISCPGINPHVLDEWLHHEAKDQAGGALTAMFNLFSGGALENCALFSLGVMPYISASIMMQMLTAVIPTLNKMQKEDGGRQKIMQYTRYATIILCILQGGLLARTQFQDPTHSFLLHGIEGTIRRLGVPLVANPGPWFVTSSVIFLTAGSMLLMWIGDQITDKGVGNGVSLIITVGIVGRLPAGLAQAWNTFVAPGQESAVKPMMLVIMVAFFVFVIAAVIAMTQAQRKISVTYAKKVVGRKMYGGQTQYLPLKVNAAGVMPIIFAQSLIIFPASIVQMASHGAAAQQFANMLSQGWLHYTIYGVMIFFFSYFWNAMQFQPGQIADDLKKYGGYIPGQRPGKPTADFLDYTMTRLTFAGATFLTIIAILPQLLVQQMQVPQLAAQFFGGTSLLIMVGVMLDTMRQIETFLFQRHYDGFLRKGKLRGQFDRTPAGRSEAVAQTVRLWVYVGIAVAVVGAAAFFLVRNGGGH